MISFLECIVACRPFGLCRGQELGYYPLGMLPDDAFELFRESPGTLDEGSIGVLSLCIIKISAFELQCIFFPLEVYGAGTLGNGPKMNAAPAGGLPIILKKTKLKK